MGSEYSYIRTHRFTFVAYQTARNTFYAPKKTFVETCGNKNFNLASWQKADVDGVLGVCFLMRCMHSHPEESTAQIREIAPSPRTACTLEGFQMKDPNTLDPTPKHQP